MLNLIVSCAYFKYMNLNLDFSFINLEYFNYFNLQYRQSSEFETWAEADDCLGHISTQLIICSPSCEKLLWWFVLWVGYQHTMLMMRPAGTWLSSDSKARFQTGTWRVPWTPIWLACSLSHKKILRRSWGEKLGTNIRWGAVYQGRLGVEGTTPPQNWNCTFIST